MFTYQFSVFYAYVYSYNFCAPLITQLMSLLGTIGKFLKFEKPFKSVSIDFK